MTFAVAALAAAAGAFASLERKAIGQLMLSRPIVVAPLLAAVLGHARAGLAVGVPLELFFLGSSSYGASTPEHETLAALFAAALAAEAAPHVAPPVAWAVAVYLGLPLAALGRRLEAALERRNEGLVERAQELLEEGLLGQASRQALVSLAVTALLGAGVVCLGMLLGPPAGAVERHLVPGLVRGLTLAWALFVGLSAALGLRAIQIPGGKVLSGVAALTVFVVFALTVLVLR